MVHILVLTIWACNKPFEATFMNRLSVTRKEIGTKSFCRYNKKISAKDFLEDDDINKKKVSI